MVLEGEIVGEIEGNNVGTLDEFGRVSSSIDTPGAGSKSARSCSKGKGNMNVSSAEVSSTEMSNVQVSSAKISESNMEVSNTEVLSIEMLDTEVSSANESIMEVSGVRESGI